ncbi:MAG: hypothetical protein ACYS47_17790 [Planctomycetota bacterium]|jgi:hypothetical protein
MPGFEPVWGLKTVAVCDAWTFEHFVAGVSIGSVVCKHHKRIFDDVFVPTEAAAYDLEKTTALRNRCNLVLLLLVAYSWETLEHYLEAGLAGRLVEDWFQGVEFWGNRMIADPLMLVLGCLSANRIPWLVWPARCVTALWLFFHIVVFPHSMHLHYIF